MSARDCYTFGDDAELEDDLLPSAAWILEALEHMRMRPERDVQLELWETRS
jgi:hypothetical protein